MLPCLAHAEAMKEFLADQQGGERDTAAEGLAEDEDVRSDSAGRIGEPVPGAAQTALDFVQDEQSASRISQFASGLQELRRENVDAALAEDRLKQDGAGVLVDRGAKFRNVIAIDKVDAGGRPGPKSIEYLSCPVTDIEPKVRPW